MPRLGAPRCLGLALAVALALALGTASGRARAEEPEFAPPEASEVPHCGPDLQACSAGDGARWCCPLQSTGAEVCCGAVAGVCHACDLEQLPDRVPSPVQPLTPAELPRVE